MTKYLAVTPSDGGDTYYVRQIEAKTQREAAQKAMNEGGTPDDESIYVYTLAKGSPVTTFRRRTETVTTIEKVGS